MPRHAELGSIKVRHLIALRIRQLPVGPPKADFPLVLGAGIDIHEGKLVAQEPRSLDLERLVVALDRPDFAVAFKVGERAVEQGAAPMMLVLAVKQPAFRRFRFEAVHDGAFFFNVAIAHVRPATEK
ncbi:hypothetical protein [Absidia glauca]|uniref:Uncharacterized protein n=1 Tax=Absidia glauca TaxID=4829 RepID=A0A168Q3M8_ABSGL|nr:hypothetical protein [Absidia glauca]